MSSKRILIFSLSFSPLVGGAEVAIKEITDRIPDIEFDMVTLRFDKAHPKFERIGSVNVYRIGGLPAQAGGLGYLSKILFVPQAAAFAFSRQYDLYWAMMTYMLFPIVVARIIGNKTPYVLTLQDGDPFERVFNRWFILPFRPLLSFGMRNAQKVQAISTFLAKWSGREDALVIPNGVDWEKFQNPKPRARNSDEIILITTSRLTEKNGIGDLVEAMKFLPDNFKLHIIGSGPLESKLKRHSKMLNLESRIRFVGEVPHHDISKYLHAAGIFVRPSLSEGMGNSFIEAMAA
ncbi:MAG: glycosyltransferase family 4 protein, partial [Parcubacteria group bacterium]